MLRNRVRGWVGLAAALVLAPAADALQITGLSVATTGSNTPDAGPVNNGNTHSQIASSTSITTAPGGAVPDTVGSSITFQTRYAELIASDRDSNGSAQTQNMTSDYSITFTVRIRPARRISSASTRCAPARSPSWATMAVGAATPRRVSGR